MANKKDNKMFVYKKSISPLFDMLAAKNLPNKVLENVKKSNKEIQNNFYINELADELHPKKINVQIKKIINEDKETKTYIFENIDKNKMPFFRAGQYVSVVLEIDGVKISRPYSISSSPYDASRKNEIWITVKIVKDGYVSNWMHKNLKVGQKLEISQPEGEFYYDNIRDPKTIIAIAGGSGITPFLSMAKSIVEGSEDFNLLILNGNKKVDNIIFKDEFIELEKKSNGKVKVINVLSEEKKSGYEHGFINLNLIKKYIPENQEYSIWMCGPKAMYKFVMKEIIPLRLRRKFIRVEASNQVGKPSMYEEYKNKGNKRIYNITVRYYDQEITIKADSNDTILTSLHKNKISAQSKCLSGLCSWCRVRVVKGDVFTPHSYDSRRMADEKNKIYYSCCSFPISDLVIEAY